MMNIRSKILGIILLGLFSQKSFADLPQQICSKSYSQLSINSNVLYIKHACTMEELSTGLMFIKKLDENLGILFVTREEQTLSFWMKNTYIPLDIAYINKNLEIVDIHTMKPLDLTSIKSQHPASYALEVNAGYFKKHNIKIGDKIKINLP